MDAVCFLETDSQPSVAGPERNLEAILLSRGSWDSPPFSDSELLKHPSAMIVLHMAVSMNWGSLLWVSLQ